jgi:hypothetical protein
MTNPLSLGRLLVPSLIQFSDLSFVLNTNCCCASTLFLVLLHCSILRAPGRISCHSLLVRMHQLLESLSKLIFIIAP